MSESKKTEVFKLIIETIGNELKTHDFSSQAQEIVSHALHAFPYLQNRITSADWPDDLCFHLNHYGDYSNSIWVSTVMINELSALYKEDDENILEMKWRLATSQSELENYSLAASMLQEISSVANQSLGEEHWLTMTIISSMATIYVKQGDAESALEIHDNVIRIQEKMLGDEHPITLTALFNKAVALNELGMIEPALNGFWNVWLERLKILGGKHAETLTAKCCTAEMFFKKGDLERALEIHKEVYEVRKDLYGLQHGDTIYSQDQINIIVSQLSQEN